MTVEQLNRCKDAATTVAAAADNIEVATRRISAVTSCEEVSCSGGTSTIVVSSEKELQAAVAAVAREMERERIKLVEDVAEYLFEFAREVAAWANKE